jgi:hypothetical protein
MPKISIPDGLNQVGPELKQKYGNRIPKSAIVDAVVKLTGWKASSVMPADFCFNRTNLGARPIEYCALLEHVSGYFEFVGRGYATARTV